MSTIPLIIFALAIFWTLRSFLLFRINTRRINDIRRLTLAEIDAGIYDRHQGRWAEFGDRRHLIQMLDLTKWTYRQFYAPLPDAPSKEVSALLDATTDKPAPRPDQICVSCARPFRFGLKSDPMATVYTHDGKREVAITGTCERCFDSFFYEADK